MQSGEGARACDRSVVGWQARVFTLTHLPLDSTWSTRSRPTLSPHLAGHEGAALEGGVRDAVRRHAQIPEPLHVDASPAYPGRIARRPA